MGIFRFFVCLFLLLLSSVSFAVDTDNDGLPDDWEDANGLNKYNYTDAISDSDDDGLTALEEYQYGTSPTHADTDNDGIDDATEINYGTNPNVSENTIILSTGTYQTCTISNNDVVCWGEWTSSYDVNENRPESFDNPIQVSANGAHACALDNSGVVCWGHNGNGIQNVPELNNPKSIHSGGGYCALDDTGIVCWGGSSRSSASEFDLPQFINLKYLVGGFYHLCALDDTGVNCWGDNTDGQLNVPDNIENPQKLFSGGSNSCVIDDNEPICWGLDDHDLLVIPELVNVRDISFSNKHACALDDSGVVCWGDGEWGRTNVPELNNPIAISTGSRNSCAAEADGSIICWGDSSNNRTAVPVGLKADFINSSDIDDDGIIDIHDYFPLDPNEWLDNDGDGIGNNADTDDDGDGVEDSLDTFPLDSSETIDTDNDGIGNNADPDDDNDGVNDLEDVLPLDPAEQVDTDNDGIGNNADTDDDGDGFNDVDDIYPLDNRYSQDTDSDGIPDAWELLYGLDPNNRADAASDQDDDGAVALQEFIEGTLPVADSDDDGIDDHLDMFPNDPTETTDADQDGVGDNSDNCPNMPNPDQVDFNNDGRGDACYEDSTPPTFTSLDTAELISENSGENQLIYRAVAYDCRENVCSPPEPLGFTFEPDSLANAQQVYISSITFSENSMQAIVTLSYKSDDPTTTGIAFDLFYDSSALSLSERNLIHSYDNIQSNTNIDEQNLDDDIRTDRYLRYSWASLFGSFPGATKTDLYQLTFDVIGNSIDSPLNIITISNDGNFSFLAYSSSVPRNPNRNNIEYSLSSNSDPELTINSENGWVTLLNNPDFEAKSSYHFTTIATDPSGNASELQVTIPLLNKDEVAPVITSSDETSIYENSGTNQVVYTAIADDTSDVSSGVSYSLIDKTDYDDSDFWMPNIVNSDEVQNYQQIYVSKSFINTETNRAELVFSLNSDDPSTTGLGFDVIFDASKLSLLEVKDLFTAGNISHPSNVTVEDGFGRVSAGWASLFGGWPGVNKVDLFTLVFETSSSAIGSEITIDLQSSGCYSCQEFIDSFYIKQSPPLSINSLTGDVSLMINPDFSSRQSFIFDVIATDNAGYISQPQTVTLNILEADTDLDGTLDSMDNCPEISNPTQLDTDNDLLGDVCDSDDDNDGTQDSFDALPLDPSEQLDHDNDGVGNNTDTDDDGDGVNDVLDLFPLDAFESADSDGDGVGDNADFFPNSSEYSLDSDLDQMPDAWERKYGLNSTDASDALLDQDNDGMTALEEYEAGTIPLKILDIDANGSFDALTDGLIILRYAFGLRGEALVNQATAIDAMRNDAADIEAYIDSLVPGL